MQGCWAEITSSATLDFFQIAAFFVKILVPDHHQNPIISLASLYPSMRTIIFPIWPVCAAGAATSAAAGFVKDRLDDPSLAAQGLAVCQHSI
jgi:hypothetical protein